MRSSELLRVTMDWHAEVELLTLEDGVPNLILRGTVDSAIEVDPDIVELDIRSWPDVLNDVGTPGILVRDAPPADFVWSVMMISGIESESLSVEGLGDLLFEEFRVVVPIYGLAISHPIKVESVQLLPSPGVPPIEVPSDSDYLAEPFRACTGIAVARVTAQTLFEAEQQGLLEIDYALGVALLDHRAAFLGPEQPTSILYSRERTLAVLGRYPVAAVIGRWGRNWLRGTRETRSSEGGISQLEVTSSRLPGFDNVPQTPEASNRLMAASHRGGRPDWQAYSPLGEPRVLCSWHPRTAPVHEVGGPKDS